MSQSLYDKYGGLSGISTVVHNFYDKISESDSLSPYFNGVDMARLISHQTNFLCKVLGGPDNYKGATLAVAHKRLHITEMAFQEVATLLKESLEEAGVEPSDVSAILQVVASTKGDVVTA